MDYKVSLLGDFDEYEWMFEAKGCLLNVRVEIKGHRYLIAFNDPVRLAQDVAADLEREGTAYLQNVVIVPRVTAAAVDAAIARLVDRPPLFIEVPAEGDPPDHPERG